MEVASQKSRPQTSGSMRGGLPPQGAKNGRDLDQVSMRSNAPSIMSGASKMSRKSGGKAPSAHSRPYDAMSWASSKKPHTEVYSESDEDDEWTAILKFNTLLHYEE